ncbi:hypothetical protein ACOSQ4_004111 [Xanthoceras sorbifolium]
METKCSSSTWRLCERGAGAAEVGGILGLCEEGALGLCAVRAGGCAIGWAQRLCAGARVGRRGCALWAAGAVRASWVRLFQRAGHSCESELGDEMLGLCDRGCCRAVALGAGGL